VQAGIDWITTWQRFDDGDGAPPADRPYDGWEMCWGRHTCHMGVVKALKALAEIPPERRSADVRRATSSPPGATPRAAGSSAARSTAASSSTSRRRVSRAAGSRCGRCGR
jgi:hypothetical protein